MRRPFIPPHMSTGGWIFATAVVVAIITSPSIYAAATSVVAIGNKTDGQMATVVPGTHQLQTTFTAPENTVRVAASTGTNTSCQSVYTPPRNKAIVVTQITYSYGSGTQGTENYGGLFTPGCAEIVDQVDTVQKFTTETRTYPSGLVMSGIAANSVGGVVTIFVNGYLIPAANLPEADASHISGRIKSVSR